RPRDQLLPGPSMNELCRLLFRPLHVVSTRPRPPFARPMHVVLTKTPFVSPLVMCIGGYLGVHPIRGVGMLCHTRVCFVSGRGTL
ncbi:unnamed protein product, partial (mitochondrion) [Musa textilis]